MTSLNLKLAWYAFVLSIKKYVENVVHLRLVPASQSTFTGQPSRVNLWLPLPCGFVLLFERGFPVNCFTETKAKSVVSVYIDLLKS